MGHHQLDSLDEQILNLVADNARIPFWKSLVHAMCQEQLSINEFRN